MNLYVKKCLQAGLTALLLLPAGCRQNGIIPSRDMETLFAAFYMADACIESANGSRAETYLNPDSMHVYKPILEKHGYTDTAFIQSLDYYLHHPKDLSAIFKKVRVRLEKEAERPLEIVDGDAEDVISEEEAPEDAMEVREGAEPAIERIEEVDKTEKEEPGIKPDPERKPQPKPVRKESKRKRMSKDDLKRLEEELKK